MYKNCRWNGGVPASQLTNKWEPLPDITPKLSTPLPLYRLTDRAVKRVAPGSVPDCLLVGFVLTEMIKAETRRPTSIKIPDAYQLREGLRKTTAPKSGLRGGTSLYR